MFEVLLKEEHGFLKILSYLHPKQLQNISKKIKNYLDDGNSKLWKEYFFSKYKSYKNNLCSPLFLSYNNHSYMGKKSDIIELIPFSKKTDAIDWYKTTTEMSSTNGNFVHKSLQKYDVINYSINISQTSLELNSCFDNMHSDLVEVGIHYLSNEQLFSSIFKPKFSIFLDFESNSDDILPNDCLNLIFQFSNWNDLLNIEMTNKNWFKIINEFENVWEKLFFKNYNSYKNGMFMDLCFGYHLHGLSSQEAHFDSMELSSNEYDVLLSNFESLENDEFFIQEKRVQQFLDKKDIFLKDLIPSTKKFDQKILTSFTIFGGEDYYNFGYFKFSFDQFNTNIVRII